jgi:hypothetical protein
MGAVSPSAGACPVTDWAFAHPILTTLIALAAIDAIAAPFRWQRRRRPTVCRNHVDEEF